jgi:hypothetical protein
MEHPAVPVYSTFSFSVCSSNGMHKNVNISKQLKAGAFTGTQQHHNKYSSKIMSDKHRRTYNGLDDTDNAANMC